MFMGGNEMFIPSPYNTPSQRKHLFLQFLSVFPEPGSIRAITIRAKSMGLRPKLSLSLI